MSTPTENSRGSRRPTSYRVKAGKVTLKDFAYYPEGQKNITVLVESHKRKIDNAVAKLSWIEKKNGQFRRTPAATNALRRQGTPAG